MQREFAETIALKALTWLLANEEILPIFLGATGASPEALRRDIQDPAFQRAILDFILQDDDWVISLCDAQNLAYPDPARAAQFLAGPEAAHWT